MSTQPVAFRPRPTAPPGSLKGYSGYLDQTTYRIANPPTPAGIPHGTEVILARVQSPKIGYAVLESLYYDGDASGAGYLHFRVTVNGQNLPLDFAEGYVAVGSSNLPAIIGENLPAGALVEIRCKNEHPSDDTLKAYCDGMVGFYERAI